MLIDIQNNKPLYDLISELSLDDFIRLKLEILERKKQELEKEKNTYISMSYTTKFKNVEIVKSKGFEVDKPKKGVRASVYDILYQNPLVGYTTDELAEMTGYTRKQVADVLTKLCSNDDSYSEKDLVNGIKKYYIKTKAPKG